MGIPILGLVENMSHAICPLCGEELKIFGESQGKSAAQEMDIDFLGCLPWDVKLNELVDRGRVEVYQSTEIERIAEMIKEKLYS